MSEGPSYTPFLDLLNETLHEQGGALYRAGVAEIEAFLPRVRRQLGADLPPDYAHFLREANGFLYSGSCFYALDEENEADQEIPGLIAKNLSLGVLFKARTPYLILGESDLWLYAHHAPSGTYHALWKDRHESIEQFSDFSEMMENALKEALGIPLDEAAGAELP
ncbi:MAG: YrhA family protein [Verrucomicrobium sp.]|nr:YrhA family protein [Verrucomicrobium sp.]